MPKEKRNSEIPPVKIYLDTCVLQGALSKQNTKDTIFMAKVKEREWSVFTSIHTLMELLDVAKDRKYLLKKVFNEFGAVKDFLRTRGEKNLNSHEFGEISTQINNFFITHKFISFGNISEDVWTDVKSIVENSNIHSSDALHLALATMWECHILVTHDQFFIREGNRILKETKTYDKLRVCDVDKVEATLKEILF